MKIEKIINKIGIVLTILTIFSIFLAIWNIKQQEKTKKEMEIKLEKQKNSPEEKEKIKRREEELKNKYQSKLHRKEVNDLTKKIEENNSDAELYFKRGNKYKYLCELKKAYNDYTKAIELEKKAKYYIERAKLYEINTIEQIDSDAKKALEISKDAVTYEAVGDIYYFFINNEKAKQYFQEAILLDSDNSKLYIKEIECEKDNAKVIELCNKYLKKFPQKFELYILRADAMIALGINKDDMGIKKILINENSKIGGSLYSEMGYIYTNEKKYTEAIRSYDKAIELELKYKKNGYITTIEAMYTNKAIIYEKIMDEKNKIEALKKVIEYNLKNEDDGLKERSRVMYNEIANYYETLSDEKKANENYKKAEEIAEYQKNLGYKD